MTVSGACSGNTIEISRRLPMYVVKMNSRTLRAQDCLFAIQAKGAQQRVDPIGPQSGVPAQNDTRDIAKLAATRKKISFLKRSSGNQSKDLQNAWGNRGSEGDEEHDLSVGAGTRRRGLRDADGGLGPARPCHPRSGGIYFHFAVSVSLVETIRS